MLAKIKQFVKTHQDDIILVVGVILISLLSFAMGYIAAKTQEKEPIRFEHRDTNILMHTNDTNRIRIISINSYIGIEFYENSHYWSRNSRVISGLEIG